MVKGKRRPRRRATGSAPPSDERYWFDAGDADGAVAFIEGNMRHWEGEFAGLPFRLLPWQKQVVRDIFGWKIVDVSEPDRTRWLRRYRYVYVEVPKGNGKSPLAAAIALVLLFWDAEAGAQVYSVAGDREQAGIVFRDASAMVEQSDYLAGASITLKGRIIYPSLRAFYQVLSSDAPRKHGLRPSGIIFDELHVQPSFEMFDTLRLGMKKRRQPMLVMITTAGMYDEESLCWNQHEYARAVLAGEIEDDEYYAVIYGAAEGDDWTADATFEKANPSAGVTVKIDDLRKECDRALKNPSLAPVFKQLHLNLWGQVIQGGFDMEAWRKCWEAPILEPGARCWVGMDLSSKLDLTSVVAVFRHDDKTYSVLPFFWIPGDGLEERKRRDVFDYPRYVKEGFITATPGNMVDQEAVREKVLEIRKTYRIQEVCFDSWNATWISGKLQEDGLTLVEIRQGPKTMSEASKALIGLVKDRQLRHGGNPVLTWNARNTVFRRDVNDGWAPTKDKKGRKRIDGIVATIDAMTRAITESGGSVYDKHGVRFA